MTRDRATTARRGVTASGERSDSTTADERRQHRRISDDRGTIEEQQMSDDRGTAK